MDASRITPPRGVGGHGAAWISISGLLAITAALVVTGCGGSTTSISTSTVVAQAVNVTATSPPSGSVINANSVTVRGTVVPSNATVEVSGQPAAVGNGVFTASADLQVGKTTIDVIGSAPGKSPGSTSIVITRPGAGGSRSAVRPSTGNQATPGVATEQAPTNNQTTCGNGLTVGPDTTCAFAGNVQSIYDANGAGTYSVYSPVTRRYYSMTCTLSGAGVVCTGGNNASVYFPG